MVLPSVIVATPHEEHDVALVFHLSVKYLSHASSPRLSFPVKHRLHHLSKNIQANVSPKSHAHPPSCQYHKTGSCSRSSSFITSMQGGISHAVRGTSLCPCASLHEQHWRASHQDHTACRISLPTQGYSCCNLSFAKR